MCGGIERNHRRIEEYPRNWIKLQITRRLHRKLIGIKEMFLFNYLLLTRVMLYFRRLNKITTILQDIKNSNLFKFRYFLSFFLVCHTDTFLLNGIILDCGNCFGWCWCRLFNFMCNESLHCNYMSYQVIYSYTYLFIVVCKLLNRRSYKIENSFWLSVCECCGCVKDGLQ